jgi:hypothetical protein
MRAYSAARIGESKTIMKPIDIKLTDYDQYHGTRKVVYAKDQPEYLPLPALVTREGLVTSCWELNDYERKVIAEGGCISLSLLTFNQPLQPIILTVQPKE